MSLQASAGLPFEATLDNAPTGLLGTLGLQIQDGAGVAVVGRTTTGIVESPAGSGVYTATVTAPTTSGAYVIVWDTGGSFPVFATEDLTVTGPVAAGTPYF